VSLFIVDRRAPGVSVLGYPTQDAQRAADVSFKSVKVGVRDRLGPRRRRAAAGRAGRWTSHPPRCARKRSAS